jgi:antitoxin component YwqK of YwqJK toxin-antitoxin module
MRKYLLFLSVFFLFSFTEVSLKKRISDAEFRYEFYTTNKAVNPEPDRQYFWFKGGAIHNSEYGLAGELLHSQYQKFYHSNQLAEAGKYDSGLKDGIWKTWFKNGTLQSNIYWNDGQKDGSYYAYDESGFLVEQGKFKNNKKHGRWINYISKDTLKYRDGKVILKKIKVKDTTQNNKPGLLKRMFTKKDSLKSGEIKTDKIRNTPAQKTKKPGFLKRIFTKKEKIVNQPVAAKQQKQTTVTDTKKKDNFFKRLFSKKEKKPKNG